MAAIRGFQRSKHAMRRLLRGSARDGRPSEIRRVALEPFQGSFLRQKWGSMSQSQRHAIF